MSEEEKKATQIVNSLKEWGKIHFIVKDRSYARLNYDEVYLILSLIDKQQKEIESLKKENLEIRDWKYTIDTIDDLDKLKELDLIKIKGKEYISKDKIKAKIEEYNKMINATYEDSTHYADYRRNVCFEIKNVLNELLEE